MVRPMSLRAQLLLLQMAIVLVTVIGTGVVASWLQEQQLRNAYRDRMIAVAQSVATLPSIIDALGKPDPASTIQPIAEVVRKASNVTYIVVANDKGIRYSHPNPDLIGEHVSTDPSTALSGHMYVGTQTGTLGTSWRVKVPIFGAKHAVIGVVSVGVLEADLRSEYLGNSVLLFITIGVAAILGVIGAAWVSTVIRKRIYGLEPEEIAGLLEEREALLHGVREGIVAVDEHGRIALINDAAARLLEIDQPADLVGMRPADVLDAELARFLASDDAEQSFILSGERVLLARRDVAKTGDRPVGTIAILRDNTELHALLRDLDGAHGLAEGLRAQAHGFANQLHVISGLLELGHVDEAVAFIARVGNGGTLTSVSSSSGIADLEISALLLVKQTQAKELGIAISIDPASTLSPLAAGPVTDALRNDLLIVIGNLLDNAIEACQHGGHISISIVEQQPHPKHREILVRVTDDGPGIPSALRGKVFAPGYSSKPAPSGLQATGRGIGLALVKRIAERHGGSVEVSDNPDLGATFTVRLVSADFVAADRSALHARRPS
ncbi:sensor histidine kinase [Microbacterium sp. STN6]|uniref:ATP-binding protein n=1 Tax=Microbacterium sp. STN6 TaxID=2995588 RepID=UPI002260D4E2|nr:sensor histidine kinase [Microbacterium sp. STN6]MCX7522012.1 sensor histidine kinase [Microbacterium sp. STN6]